MNITYDRGDDSLEPLRKLTSVQQVCEKAILMGYSVTHAFDYSYASVNIGEDGEEEEIFIVEFQP